MTLKIHIMLRIHHKVRAPLVVRYVHGLRTAGFFSCSPREDTVSVAQSYQYDDGSEACGTDTFIREPFVVMFSSNHSGTAGGRRATQVSFPHPPRPSKAAPLLCFFFCSRGELCRDPSAHVSRLRPGGNGRALRRGAGRPLPLEHQRERALKVDATADSEEPSLYLCFCPCRTSFFWATSTPTVPTSQAQTGTRSVSSPTTASTG